MDKDYFDRSTRAKVGEWGWSMSASSSARQERFDELMDDAQDAIFKLATSEPGLLPRWTALKKATLAAEDTVEALVKQSAGKDAISLGQYATELAEMAVMLDLLPEDRDFDRMWARLSSEWRTLMSGRYERDPDVVAEAWRNKPGSISSCLGTAIAVLTITVAAFLLAAPTILW